ncbi:MAG: hypothetical protein U5L72_03285 [Bacteroidales bacterium]|nr:hypothetical protein [Bacteroidales bacterium]
MAGMIVTIPPSAPTGSYLLFTSARTFDPVFSNTEWNHAYQNMDKIYLVILSKTTRSPFAPVDNQVGIKTPETATDKPAGDKKAETPKASEVKVDLDGIQNRIVELPVERVQLWGYNLFWKKDLLPRKRNTNQETIVSIKMYDLDKKEEKELGTGMIFIVTY